METSAPDITNSATIGQVIAPTPAATPTLSPAGPPPVGPYYPIKTPTPMPYGPSVPSVLLVPKMYTGKPLIIYGYGPVNSTVNLVGFGVSETTRSKENGYYEFSQIYSYSYTYPELCIQAIDLEKRVTQPTCIPALPESALIPVAVGPVILSPTISIDSNNVLVGESVVASGITIPNSLVDVFFAKSQGRQISLVKIAHAYVVPKYQIRSNEKGEFDFSLPTQTSSKYNLFASSLVGDARSAKSNTLTFSVLSRTQSNLQIIKKSFLDNNLLWFILLEIIIIICLVVAILRNPSKSKFHRKEVEEVKEVEKVKKVRKVEEVEKVAHVGLENGFIEKLKRFFIKR